MEVIRKKSKLLRETVDMNKLIIITITIIVKNM